ncbi:MAG: hypothetical protein GY913_32125 [Proteobacteria bacterium]|nr:hypothetical protein [Pseudomonadota bacterium]MCP4921569.1 hypothetical protein [Pseudomonadota bacterium]
MPAQSRAETTETSTSTSSSATSNATVDTEQELVGNQAIIDIVEAENKENTDAQFDPDKTGIVHVGMNKYARDEANTLNRANRDRGGAIGIRNQRVQDEYKWQGVTYDLTQIEDCAKFVATLGLKAQTAVNAAQWIADGGSEAKDEMAQMVRVWGEAELGIRKMDRVVLSGHSVGSMIWGDDNGQIDFDTITELSAIFPKAVAGVKHLMLSACYTGGEAKMAQYPSMFPNLESVWAYHDSSPGTWTGAMDHMKSWEGATEEGDDASKVDPELAGNARKAKNVSTWNVADGYQGQDPMNLYEIRNQVSEGATTFNDFFAGNVEVENTGTGPLRDYYNVVQRYLSHPDAGDVATFETRRDVTIRLIYWGVVRGKFADHYASQLTDAYTSMGVDMPDFSSMSRGDFMAHWETVKDGEHEVVDLMKRGLHDLSPEVIPSTWV